MMVWIVVGVLASYLCWAAVRLGLHQRLPLALGPISLDRIPDRAARRYGERVLFTSDQPCAWEVPALRECYPDLSAWSAARIARTAAFVARLLRDGLGVAHGDRVAILKQNHLDIHILAAAVVRAGGVACPINGRFAADKLHPYLANIGAGVLISDGATLLRLLEEDAAFGPIRTIVLAERRSESLGTRLRGQLAAAAPGIELVWLEQALTGVREGCPAVRRGSDEPLYLVHSSGTTGFPKAVVLKNGPQSHAVRGWLCYVHVARGVDRGYMAVPNNHQAVLLTFNSVLLLGGRVHWTGADHRDGFEAERVVRELADGGFTGFFGFPIVYAQLKEVPLDRYDLRAMRFWGSTADASHEVLQRPFVRVGSTFRRLGLPFTGSVYLDAQGSSEVGTPSVIRYVTPFTRRFGRRIGRPGSTPFGPRIRVVREDGQLARRGEVGRLEVRGRTLFAGYWNDDALTYRAVRDGWFFTGDVVRRGGDGNLIQLDREVDVIHTRGGPVYSLPIEERIHKHPAVFDACVYAERQEDGWQLPSAAIALRQGWEISAAELREQLNHNLAAVERLHRLEVLPWEEFPVGVTGKTLKRVFRARTERREVEEQNRPVICQ